MNVFFKCIAALCCLAFATACGGPSQSATSCSTGIATSETAYTALASPYRAALTGCTFTDYNVQATIGDSASPLSVIVDTGSTTLAVAGSGCTTGCTGLSPLYVASTNQIRTCAAEYAEYGDGTNWTGSIVGDTVSVGGITAASMPFADITTASSAPAFFSDFDCNGTTSGLNTSQGIMGFAGPQVALNYTASYLDVLNAAQSFPEIFALQLCMEGGNMWLGGWDTTYSSSGTATYTPMVSDDSYYFMTIEEIQVGSTNVSSGATYSDGGIIVDSGTSITYLPSSIYTALVTQVEASSSFTTAFGSSAGDIFDNGDCLPSTESQTWIDTNLPPLILTLPSTGGGTVTVSLPPSRSYLDVHTIDNQLEYCSGVAPDGLVPDILGGTFMRSQIVIFDRASSRIGFAPQNTLNTGAASCTN